MSHGTVYKISHNELELSKLSTRWVLKTLSNDHKTRRTETSRRKFDRMNSDPENSFNRIVIKDQTWVHQFDPEPKTHSMEWRKKSPPLRKLKGYQKEQQRDDIYLLGFPGKNYD